MGWASRFWFKISCFERKWLVTQTLTGVEVKLLKCIEEVKLESIAEQRA